MKQNYETCIVGTKAVLVPYRRAHVERYHSWMQSEVLLEATGSEPLSLEEEYEMQQSWREDENKCTFIILLHGLLKRDPAKNREWDDNFVSENLDAMVGDVNLFLSEEEDDEENQESSKPVESVEKTCKIQAELDIMVAEEAARGQGIGLEAACLMMLYGAHELAISSFFCKINENNEPSLAMFRKLNFVECNYAACFNQYEYELRRHTPDEVIECIAPFLSSAHLSIFRCASDIDVSTTQAQLESN